jgi:hypothetical protein
LPCATELAKRHSRRKQHPHDSQHKRYPGRGPHARSAEPVMRRTAGAQLSPEASCGRSNRRWLGRVLARLSPGPPNGGDLWPCGTEFGPAVRTVVTRTGTGTPSRWTHDRAWPGGGLVEPPARSQMQLQSALRHLAFAMIAPCRRPELPLVGCPYEPIATDGDHRTAIRRPAYDTNGRPERPETRPASGETTYSVASHSESRQCQGIFRRTPH